MSVMDYAAQGVPQNLMAQPGQRLQQNPMLPQHPQDEALDSEYYAQEALMRQQVAQQYADILQQLGYTDPSGKFIPGSVTTQAAQKQADYQRSSDIAGQEVTRTSQQQGTLFSGIRAENTARAQYPFQQAITQLGIDVPMQLGQLYGQAAGLTGQYTLQQNQLLASAAQRKAAALAAQQAAQAQADALAALMRQQGQGAQAPQYGGGGEEGGGGGLAPGLTQPIQPPTALPGYGGTGAGGFTGSTTPPAVVAPAPAPKPKKPVYGTAGMY